jgi:outer membrane protein assembly factor BamB
MHMRQLDRSPHGFQITDGGQRHVFASTIATLAELHRRRSSGRRRNKAKSYALELAGKSGRAAAGGNARRSENHVLCHVGGGRCCPDGETGRTIWTTSVGNPRYPTTAAAANEKFVGVCNGSTLYVMLASDGSQVWTLPAISSPGAGPALSTDLIFVPMVTGQIESFLLEDPTRPVKIYQSFGRAMVTVVLANSVAWPTDKGNLYVGMANDSGVRFRMEAKQAITSAPAFLAPDKIFVTSLDGYLYCVSESRGNMVWRFTTGEPISHSPVTLGDRVYVITDRGNMFAIDTNTAQDQVTPTSPLAATSGLLPRRAATWSSSAGRARARWERLPPDSSVCPSSTLIDHHSGECHRPGAMFHESAVPGQCALCQAPKRTPSLRITPGPGRPNRCPNRKRSFGGNTADPFAARQTGASHRLPIPLAIREQAALVLS